MTITREADYAVRITRYLASIDAKQDAETIANSVLIPKRFALKILRKLVHGGILKSYKGINGGYELKKTAKEITLNDIVELIDGPIAINRCLISGEKCVLAGDVKTCSVHRALEKANELIRETLSNVNFEELLKD